MGYPTPPRACGTTSSSPGLRTKSASSSSSAHVSESSSASQWAATGSTTRSPPRCSRLKSAKRLDHVIVRTGLEPAHAVIHLARTGCTPANPGLPRRSTPPSPWRMQDRQVEDGIDRLHRRERRAAAGCGVEARARGPARRRSSDQHRGCSTKSTTRRGRPVASPLDLLSSRPGCCPRASAPAKLLPARPARHTAAHTHGLEVVAGHWPAAAAVYAVASAPAEERVSARASFRRPRPRPPHGTDRFRASSRRCPRADGRVASPVRSTATRRREADREQEPKAAHSPHSSTFRGPLTVLSRCVRSVVGGRPRGFTGEPPHMRFTKPTAEPQLHRLHSRVRDHHRHTQQQEHQYALCRLGTQGNDHIFGLNGNDTLAGGAGKHACAAVVTTR